MYSFTSPFDITWEMIQTLRGKFKDKLINSSAALTNSNIQVEINFSTLLIPEKTHIKYEFEIIEEQFIETFIIHDKIQLISKIKDVEKTKEIIENIFSFYGVLSHDFLPGIKEEKEQTEEIIKNIILKNDANYRLNGNLISKKTNHEKSIYFCAQKNGFYYFCSHWGMLKKKEELEKVWKEDKDAKNLVKEIEELIKQNQLRILLEPKEHQNN